MSETFGLILAGGEGSRLGGVRKADLRIGGMRLVERVACAFEGKVAELFIASGQGAVPGFSGACIRDEASVSTGPLAGIRATMRHLEKRGAPDDWLVTVAVDTPLLPPDYVERLRDAAAETGAAYAAWGGNIYPTNSAWRLSALREVLEGTSESAGPRALLGRLGAIRADWSDDCPADSFANVNTLAELIALQRRAMGAAR